MAVVPMQKIKIVVHSSRKEELLELLQAKGALEISDITDNKTDVNQSVLDHEHHDVEYMLAKISFAIDFLKDYEQKKTGIAAMLQGDIVDVTSETFDAITQQFAYMDVVEKIEGVDAELNTINNRIKELSEESVILKPWENLTHSLGQSWETSLTRMVVGSINKDDLELFINDINQNTPYFYLKKVSETETQVFLVVVYMKDEQEVIQKIFQDYKYTKAQLMDRQGTPSEELVDIKKEQSALIKKERELKCDLRKIAHDLPRLKVIYDYITWKKEKKIAQKKFLYTKSTAVIEGWIPKRVLSKLEGDLAKKIPESDISLIKPNEGEAPPVILRNSNFMQPFESVTRIYGLPLHNEIDPTPYLSVFFVVFFGFCLTDAGYGIALMILSVLLIKLGKIPRKDQGLLRLIFYGGVLTTILGALFGGWFGLDPELLVGSSLSFLVHNVSVGGVDAPFFWGQIVSPMKSPLLLLGVAFMMGYVQVTFGKVVDGYWKLKNKQIKDAIFDSFSWVFLLLAIAFFIVTRAIPVSASLSQLSLICVLAGVSFLVFSNGRREKSIIMKLLIGILGLYDLVGFVSDTLSYARLLALGLATGIIAMSINLIATLIGGMVGEMIPLPYLGAGIGFMVTICILVGGHVFNLALNSLGSFIHSGRLQFIEFFGKFLEGGGSEFKPLEKTTKYLRLEEISS